MTTEQNCHDPSLYGQHEHCEICDDPIKIDEMYWYDTKNQVMICMFHDHKSTVNPTLQLSKLTKERFNVYTDDYRYKYQYENKLKQHGKKGSEIMLHGKYKRKVGYYIIYRRYWVNPDTEPLTFKDNKKIRDVLREFYS